MIVTCYSYKGGVGRSMAIANLAEYLCLKGARVVVIDWDLEAPGLESFFVTDRREVEKIRQNPGLIDLILDYAKRFDRFARTEPSLETEKIFEKIQPTLPSVGNYLQAIHKPAGDRACLLLLSAGARAGERFSGYSESVQAFDWAAFYDTCEGERFFDWLRNDLLGAGEDGSGLADVVLVDSRTGVSEMSGVCTRQLADVVVAFCAPNLQNLEGILEMVRSFRRPEILAWRGGRPEIVLVPTRIDISEIESRDRFEKRFREVEAQFLPSAFAKASRSFWDLQIPYIPKFAYEEALTFSSPKTRAKVIEVK